MNPLRLRSALFLSTVLLTLGVQAEPVHNYLPNDALGFVLIRNLGAASAKIERVTKLFAEVSPMPIPAPLPVLKAATGLGAGINEQGDALLALLPGTRQAPNQRPLLLVPVSDYSAFASSLNGDTSGDICRVTISGEEVLVASLGQYAVLMNVEHRELLEGIVAAKPRPLPSIEPLGDWLTKVDVAVALTPSGLDMLTSMGRARLAGRRRAMEERPGQPQLADNLRQVQSTLAMYEEVLGFLGGELEAMAIGVAIDDDANVKLQTQAILSKSGEIANLAAPDSTKTSALAGYRDEPYVFAGGGPIPPEYGELSADFARGFLRAHPESYGFKELSEEQWQEVGDAWQAAMKGITSLSMAMLPGDADDPLYSNFYGIVQVEDAAAYLKSYAKSIELWNKLLAHNTTGIKFQYDTEETELAGKKGLLLTADLSEVANDQNVPMMKPMMEALLGKEGKMRIYLMAVDEHTVYMGIAEKDEVAARMESVLKQENGLAQSSEAEMTLALLDPKSAWIGLVSPKGAVTWATRLFALIFAQFGQGAPTIPEFPQSPPLGVALSIGDGRMSTELACPAELLKAAAAYIAKLQDAS
jgi:hypothetical protein